MPVFQDTPSFSLVPDGEYIYEITEFTSCIEDKGKLKGCRRYNMTLTLSDEDGNDAGRIKETLHEAPQMQWKFDQFIRSCNAVAEFKLSKGQAYEFMKDDARTSKCPWVDPIGLMGHCKIAIEKYSITSIKDGSLKEGERNKVTFVDNKGMVPRKTVDTGGF